jgi:hypothetical protein
MPMNELARFDPLEIAIVTLGAAFFVGLCMVF